jgi:steroid delta-isomerase-like uncharacterized protein
METTTEKELKWDLVQTHLRAEGAGDIEGAVAVYTDDIEHDVVGWPGSPAHGREAAREFYRYLTANFRTESEQPRHMFEADDFLVLEQDMTGTVIGELLGIPGNGRRITFRLLHVFQFAAGKISREQVWLDGGSIVAQLS